MADKSTRTDDALLLMNGEIDSGTNAFCPPTTTNAATMTTVAAVQTEPVPQRPTTVQVVAGGAGGGGGGGACARNHIHRQESRTECSKQTPNPPPTVRKFVYFCWVSTKKMLNCVRFQIHGF